MRVILDNLLMLGHTEDGRIRCAPLATDVGELLHQISSEARVTDKHHRSIEVNCTPSDLRAKVDPQLVRHIVGNLLTNACKYSPDGQPVQLDAVVREHSIELSVTDHGIGIPPEDQSRLFSFFFRARNVGGIPGSGLGLLVVKRCVEAHHGSIALTSALGQGTRFTVTLPLHPLSS